MVLLQEFSILAQEVLLEQNVQVQALVKCVQEIAMLTQTVPEI